MIIFELTTEMAIPKGFSSTHGIANKGFRGMRSLSPASSSVLVDNVVLRNTFLAILPTLAAMLEFTPPKQLAIKLDLSLDFQFI